MVATTSSASVPNSIGPAESAWLQAISRGNDAQRDLMLADCVLVHGPVGNIHDREEFLRYNLTMGAIASAVTTDVHVVESPGMAIVSCHQKMRVEFASDLTPFLIQAAVTRVWFSTAEGWKLGLQQLSRRQPTG